MREGEKQNKNIVRSIRAHATIPLLYVYEFSTIVSDG